MTTPTIQTLSKAMSDAAALSYYAAVEFGQYSWQHKTKRSDYRLARDRYEAACAAAGVAAYATYDAA